MRSGLFFKLMNSNPSIVLSQKSLFKYTFLESSYLNTKLKEDATCHSNKSILDFLERPFSLKQLQGSTHVNDIAKQHIEASQKIYYSLRKQKTKIIDNIQEMADRNILDLEMWRKVFAEVMELRYDELKQHPKLYEVLNHFEGYFSKFDTNLYKFSLDQKEAISLLTLREKCTDMYKNRKFQTLKLETSVINFFTKAASKTQINIKILRQFYKKITQSQNFFKQVIQPQNDILDLIKFEAALDRLQLAKKELRQIISQRIEQITADSGKIVFANKEQYVQLLSAMIVIGQMRQQYKAILPEIVQNCIQQYPELLLQAIVACRVETQELLQPILQKLSSKPIQNVYNKQQVHRTLHILEVRNFDLARHQKLTNGLCTLGCKPISRVISQFVNPPILSKCMRADKSPNLIKSEVNNNTMQVKWIISAIKSACASERVTFTNLMICRFNVFFGYISKSKIYVLNLTHLNKAINLPKQSRVIIQQRKELFEFYNIKEIQVDIKFKAWTAILESRKKQHLIKKIQEFKNK